MLKVMLHVAYGMFLRKEKSINKCHAFLFNSYLKQFTFLLGLDPVKTISRKEIEHTVPFAVPC
jgi:hypothetical protein